MPVIDTSFPEGIFPPQTETPINGQTSVTTPTIDKTVSTIGNASTGVSSILGSIGLRQKTTTTGTTKANKVLQFWNQYWWIIPIVVIVIMAIAVFVFFSM
jgi:hypothetical protein